MNPTQVIDMLNRIGEKEGLGLVMTRQTLLRYEWQKLIPDSQRGSKGRGAGRWTEYPICAVPQAYAAWSLLHGYYGGAAGNLFFGKSPKMSPKIIALIREAYFARQEVFDFKFENDDKIRHNLEELFSKRKAAIEGKLNEIKYSIIGKIDENNQYSILEVPEEGTWKVSATTCSEKYCPAEAEHHPNETKHSVANDEIVLPITNERFESIVKKAQNIENQAIDSVVKLGSDELEMEKESIHMLLVTFCMLYSFQLKRGEKWAQKISEG